MPAQSELLLKEWLRLGAWAWVGGRGRLEVLAEERHPRGRDIVACISRLFLIVCESVVGPDRRLVEGKDERGSLRNDFGEAGCALERFCEGADRVDAAYVAKGGKSVRDGGSGGLYCLSNLLCNTNCPETTQKLHTSSGVSSPNLHPSLRHEDFAHGSHRLRR